MPARPRLALWAQIGGEAILAEAQRHLGDAVIPVRSVQEVAQAVAAGVEFLVLSDPVFSAELAAVLHAPGSRVRWIQALTTGTDQLQRFGVPAGVVVSNIGPAYAPSVATHAVALLLALQRRLPAALAAQAEGRWDRSIGAQARVPFGQRGLVLGLGPIGQEICRLLAAFGMRMRAVTRSGAPSDLVETWPVTRLDAALAEADALILAAPLTPQTHGILSAERLARCPPGLLLVNIGRGGLVDTDALVAALHAGRIGGAALDVTDPEPLPPDHPLWRAPNLIVTPHIAGLSGEVSAGRVRAVLGANLARVLAGDAPAHQVMG
jgi:phosphoglycerate dehydrogenase-like enzyme